MYKRVGVFFVWVSLDFKYLFMLSLKIEVGVINIRIVMCDGKFLLD